MTECKHSKARERLKQTKDPIVKKLDKQKVVDWVKSRTTFFYRGATVLIEFEEFLHKLNEGDFDA